MRSEAYKLSGFTIVISALGFLLRWLQDMRIQDSETGLPANAAISWLVAGIMVLAAAALWGFAAYLKRYDAPTDPDQALAGHTPLIGIIGLLPAVVLALSGLIRAIHPADDVLWPTMHRICGVATLVGAFGAGTLAMNSGRGTASDGSGAKEEAESRQSARRRGAVMMMLFAVVWLITGYRDAATDPIVWRFVVEILAQCVVLLAIYYFSGYFFNSPHPWWAVVSCDLGALLCIMSAIDPNGLAQSLAFGAMAMQLLIWSFVITENLKTKPLGPAVREDGGPEE